MQNNENSNSNKILNYFALLCSIPLFIIFISYQINPDSTWLTFIYDRTQNIPSVISLYNPVMTKVMDLYCKLAPLFAIFIFFFLLKRRVTLKTIDRKKLIHSCIFSPLLYAFCVYFFLCRDFELTTAGRPLKIFAKNDLSLLITYVAIFNVFIFLTYAVCYVPPLAINLIKKR